MKNYNINTSIGKRPLVTLIFMIFLLSRAVGMYILIPMDETQKNHLKSYGIAYWVLEQNAEVKWLLNYRGEVF